MKQRKQEEKKNRKIEELIEYYDKLPYNVVLEPWDDGHEQYWVARVVELPHCLIHSNTPEAAIQEIQEVKREWIKSNLERGLEIPEPIPHRYSGQLRIRMSPSLHKLLTIRADIEKVSLNQLMVTSLARSVGYLPEVDKKSNREAANNKVAA
jgi:predicted RNase H-like HicB family nuclease